MILIAIVAAFLIGGIAGGIIIHIEHTNRYKGDIEFMNPGEVDAWMCHNEGDGPGGKKDLITIAIAGKSRKLLARKLKGKNIPTIMFNLERWAK